MTSISKASSGTINSGLDPNLSFKLLFKDKDWTLKTGIGGIFNALSVGLFCINPLFFPVSICLMALVQGYVLKILREKIADQNAQLPKWSDWFDLFVSGMSWIALMTMFFFVVMIILQGCFFLGALLHTSKAVDSSFVYWASLTILSINLVSAWFLFFSAVLMANFAKEESMVAGFQYLKVLGKISKQPKDFICAWLLGVGIQALFFFVPLVTVVGALFLPTTVFISQLLTASIMAQAWRSASLEEELATE